MSGSGGVTLDRWIIDPVNRKVTQQRLDDRFQEFPRIDERLTAQRHRYGYSAVIGEFNQTLLAPSGRSADHGRTNALLKHNVAAAATVQAHEFPPGATIGEPIFVPTSPEAGEDEGFVMAFVYDPDRRASDLAIIAAQDFKSEPVALVHLPMRVPIGLHGNWITDA
jgi:carotenoid cleavage dioxygenase